MNLSPCQRLIRRLLDFFGNLIIPVLGVLCAVDIILVNNDTTNQLIPVSASNTCLRDSNIANDNGCVCDPLATRVTIDDEGTSQCTAQPATLCSTMNRVYSSGMCQECAAGTQFDTATSRCLTIGDTDVVIGSGGSTTVATQQGESTKKLSKGALAGIIVGSVLMVLIIVVVLVVVRRRKDSTKAGVASSSRFSQMHGYVDNYIAADEKKSQDAESEGYA
ncbi:MAG: hypothetical protein MHMPM18_000863 [Marteilia pararefringens]